jgi:hypothetical protein
MYCLHHSTEKQHSVTSLVTLVVSADCHGVHYYTQQLCHSTAQHCSAAQVVTKWPARALPQPVISVTTQLYSKC